MFHLLAEDITYYLVKNKAIEIDNREVYVYGLEALIMNALLLFLCFIESIVLGEIKHFIVFLAAFVPLRISSGGFHAKRSDVCFISSILLFTATLAVTHIAPELYRNLLVDSVFILCILAIWMFAPVEHHANPLDNLEKRKNKVSAIAFSCIDVIAFAVCVRLKYQIATSIATFVFSAAILMILGLMKTRTCYSDIKE